MGCRLWGHTESDTTEATWQRERIMRDHQEVGEPIFSFRVCGSARWASPGVLGAVGQEVESWIVPSPTAAAASALLSVACPVPRVLCPPLCCK